MLESDDRLGAAIVNSLSAHIAVLDSQGKILAVNNAWKRFARESHVESARMPQTYGDCLEVCCHAAAGQDTVSRKALEGIQAVIHGQREFFELVYPCRAPEGQRWFAVTVVPFLDEGGGVVVSHRDVTDLKGAEHRLKAALQEIRSLKERLESENEYLREEAGLESTAGEIVGSSPAIRGVLAQAEQVAAVYSTVLLLGETGTGKELVALRIHDLSSRRARTMVKVNCAALPATLIEAELFGREKGAYTGSLSRQLGRFEVADGSTLFLDEICELPLELQGKLLRVLQERQIERLGSSRSVTVDVRVIAATNRDMETLVQQGRFREDLYYRLNVFPIRVPPLRDRPEDLPELVWCFVREFSQNMRKPVERVHPGDMEMLQRYDWPGNVRELRNVVERSMILCKEPTLRIALPDRRRDPAFRGSALDEVQRRHILEVLHRTGWRIRGSGGAAELLGLKPTTLEARMKKLGLRRER